MVYFHPTLTAPNLRPNAKMFLLDIVNDNTTHFAGVIVLDLQQEYEGDLLFINIYSYLAHAGYGSILIN